MNEMKYLRLRDSDGTYRTIGIIGTTDDNIIGLINTRNTNIEKILMETFPTFDGCYEFVDRYDYLSNLIVIDDLFDREQTDEET